MTVCTPNFTLCDFFLDFWPVVPSKHCRNGLDFLTSNMVELKADGIGFATIHTGVLGQVGEHLLLVASLCFSVAFPRFAEVVGHISLIMGFQLGTCATPAVSLSQPPRLHTVVEFADCFLLATTDTGFRFHLPFPSWCVQAAVLYPVMLLAFLLSVYPIVAGRQAAGSAAAATVFMDGLLFWRRVRRRASTPESKLVRL
jgi:hypothetical protein